MRPALHGFAFVLSPSKDGRALQAALRQAQHGVGVSCRRRKLSPFPLCAALGGNDGERR